MNLRVTASALALAGILAAMPLPQSSTIALAGMTPHGDDLLYRRYRGDDEVSDERRGRGRGRGGDRTDDGHGGGGGGGGGDSGGGGSSKGGGGKGGGRHDDGGGSNSGDRDDRFGN